VRETLVAVPQLDGREGMRISGTFSARTTQTCPPNPRLRFYGFPECLSSCR